MKRHVFYALFEDAAHVQAALGDLQAAGITSDHYSVIEHRDAYEVTEPEDLKLNETDAREGLIEGVTLGGLAGALGVALVTGPVGLVGIGPLAAALTAGAVAGGVYGGLGSALFALGLPDRSLESLSDHLKPGRILLSVAVDSKTLEREIEATFERHGAVAKEKHVF